MNKDKLNGFIYPNTATDYIVEEIALGEDYILYVTKPGQLIVDWDYSLTCKLTDDEKSSVIRNGRLLINLQIARSRGYTYYTYSKKSKCCCLSLRRVSSRVCRFCEYKKYSSENYLKERGIRERGTPEKRRKNNMYLSLNHPYRTEKWRNKLNIFGEQEGMKRTLKTNNKYAKGHPEVIKINRDRYDINKVLATPLGADVDAIASKYKETRRRNELGEDMDTDHYIPLRGGIGHGVTTFQLVCGLHVAYNLRTISKSENIKKSNIVPDEFSNNYSGDDIKDLKRLAKKVGLTKNGYLPDEEIKRLYKKKKLEFPNLLKRLKGSES